MVRMVNLCIKSLTFGESPWVRAAFFSLTSSGGLVSLAQLDLCGFCYPFFSYIIWFKRCCPRMTEIQIYSLIKICCSNDFIILIVLCYKPLMQKPPTILHLLGKNLWADKSYRNTWGRIAKKSLFLISGRTVEAWSRINLLWNFYFTGTSRGSLFCITLDTKFYSTLMRDISNV